MAKSTFLILVAALTLSGCSAAQMRGTPAQTAAECKADYDQEIAAANASRTTATSGGLGVALLTSLFSAGAKVVTIDNSIKRYDACLISVGATPEMRQTLQSSSAELSAPAQAQQRAASYAPGCRQSSSVMVGGSSYCVQ